MNERCMATGVVNLSKRNLLPAEIRVLSKGIGFNPTDATPTNFLAGLESILLTSVLPEDKRADIRSCATGILRQKRHQQTLPVEEAQGLRSLKSDHSIAVVPADKGGATVIIDKTDYVNRANIIFSDTDSYTILAEDPTKKQAAAIKKKVNEFARLKVIGTDDSMFMSLSDPHIAHAYGLPKVHKTGALLRIIVPLIGSPTYNLAKWLYKHLKPLTHGSRYGINSSHEFLNRIEGLNEPLVWHGVERLLEVDEGYVDLVPVVESSGPALERMQQVSIKPPRAFVQSYTSQWAVVVNELQKDILEQLPVIVGIARKQ
ncbi:hypothetical protein SprV_0501870300 [Sparganum proliferum]